jgi:insecticidal toxin complex protein TccC
MRYHLTDHLGSGTLELDEHANVQSREAYYPFGGTAWEDHSDQSGAWKTLRYSGKERDATGLYYYGYRYFAPWLSRWINPDPAGAVDGLNLYGFVGNSPVSFTDSDGWMKERVGDFLASGRELRDREELVADDRLAMWSLISEGLQAAPAPLVPSAIIENFEFGSQDSQSSTVSEGTALSFARLGDSIGPVSIDEIELAISEPANPEPVAGPSSAIQSVSSSGLVPTSGGRRNKKCTMCDKAFTTNSNLAEHIRTHSGTKPFVCSNCGSSFFRKSHLTRHMNAHSGEKPFKCTICGKSFAEMTKLSVHSRIHSIENPLTCSVCNKGFSEKRGLTIHLRVHAGEKPYMCEVCGKSFSQSGHLTQHVKSHSDQKPYGCDLCDRSYKSQSNLARHKKNHV